MRTNEAIAVRHIHIVATLEIIAPTVDDERTVGVAAGKGIDEST